MCEQPCEGNLAGRSVVLVCDDFNVVDEFKDVWEVLLGEARQIMPIIFLV